MKFRLFLGYLVFIIGFVIMLVSSSQFTGRVVIGRESIINSVSLYGVAIIIAGLLIILTERLENMVLPDSEIIDSSQEQKISRFAAIANRTIPTDERAEAKLLMDSSFIKYLEDKHVTLPEDFFRAYNPQVSQKVIQELNHRSYATKQPLVSSRTINYLRNRLGTTILPSYTPSDELKQKIVNYWLSTEKGKRSNDSEIDKFWNSADMEMLCYAYDRKKEWTIILTRDSDIFSISKKLAREGVNVVSYGPDDLNLN